MKLGSITTLRFTSDDGSTIEARYRVESAHADGTFTLRAIDVVAVPATVLPPPSRKGPESFDALMRRLRDGAVLASATAGNLTHAARGPGYWHAPLGVPGAEITTSEAEALLRGHDDWRAM